jgi:hypothetical protein
MSTQVLTRNHRIYSAETFTANIGPRNIPVDHIIEIDYSVTGLQNGTTAPTFAGIKALIDEVVLNLGGREICRLDATDVPDLNLLWFGQSPQTQNGGGDNYRGLLEPMTIPLSLDKEVGGQMRTLDIMFTFGTAWTNTDNARIYCQAPYLSNKNVSWLPAGYHYAYQYRSFTPATSAQHVNFPRKGADLIGLLIYNGNVDTANASFANAVDWVTLYVNDQPVYGPVYWYAMRTFQNPTNGMDDTTLGVESRCYRYLDFSKAPLPADFLDIETMAVTNTDTSRFIGVFVEP